MLSITDISIRLAGRLLIDHGYGANHAGHRVGLVGRNGTGKTTLFRAIAGELAPEHRHDRVRRAGGLAVCRRRRPAGPKA